MAEQPLVRQDNAPETSRVRGPVLIVAALVVAVAIAGAAWWFMMGRQAAPDWERLTELDLAAPAGYAFSSDTPWMRLELAPARPGAENTFRISLAAPRITPVPDSMSATVSALLVQPLSGEAAPPQQLPLQMGPDGALVATAPLDRAGWWRILVLVEGSPDPAQFYLLLPDPNVNGPGAVQSTGSSAEGEAVFRRAVDGIHSLHSVKYSQWLGDGSGNDSVSEHAVISGEGTPTAFTFRVTGGIEAVVIGETRWIRLPDPAGWQEQETSPAIPLSVWGEEYTGATGFTLLGEETIDGEVCQVLAFVVPEQTEPRRQTVAWYLWWVGKETGHLRQEAMASRVHYMKNDFSDFDAPFVIAPPQIPATPATPIKATPTP